MQAHHMLFLDLINEVVGRRLPTPPNPSGVAIQPSIPLPPHNKRPARRVSVAGCLLRES
jgi:hypothetical protein